MAAAAKTVAEKLVIKPGHTVWLSHPDRVGLLGPLPAGVEVGTRLGDADVAVLFADDAASIRAVLTEHRADVATRPVLWVVYPKANRTDVNRDSLWPILAGFGVRPVSQVAVDATWSALRFRAYKEGEAPFAPGS
ncbi:hypothetical protein [Streptacidiphilus cavernicola]|uniref:DUF3052 domain-containing protein n=1 Tax=Streptacidiphilus cavernicola TaxID=3342716 RepID=A0ABV6VWJ1_9ACTN